MKLLLINTCGMEGVVALAEGGSIVAVEALAGRSTSETLIPAVRRLLGADGLRGLGAIAVVHGPGSFTGVRVGLSAAKGLCEAGGLPMVALSRLGLVAGQDGLALLDAGRGEYFCGLYASGRCVWERLLRVEELRPMLASRALVTCEQRVAETAPERLGTAIRLVEEPGSEVILAAASARIVAGEWSDVATIDANYQRRTDAELLMAGR